MCDCYMAKCAACDNKISIHVADFCTARDNVKVYCPDCLHKIPELDSSEVKIFISKVEQADDVWENDKPRRRYIGKNVIFVCTDLEAYGICLN